MESGESLHRVARLRSLRKRPPSSQVRRITRDGDRPRSAVWYDAIGPAVRAGKKALIAAHGNSLRALVRFLANVNLNIPTGAPMVDDLDKDLGRIEHRYIGDQEAIHAAINAVANQAKKK
jgi:bisphosphoglycerate-dependent phosphoglycerate mutase family 1